MAPDHGRHPLDLASGSALAAVAAIDLFIARSLSLVAYVQPHLVPFIQRLELGLSTACVVGVAAVLLFWPLLPRRSHRRVTLTVLALQTAGLTLDILGLLASTIFGKRANPIYLLLEAALVHLSMVLLFAVWYAAIDHHRQLARAQGHAARPQLAFPQHSTAFPGYENWQPGMVDYLTFAFTTATSLGPNEAAPLAPPAKLLVSYQVALSLIVLVVLAARAIGLIS